LHITVAPTERAEESEEVAIGRQGRGEGRFQAWGG